MKDETGRIESMADGMAPLVHVTAVESTGERCQMEIRQETR